MRKHVLDRPEGPPKVAVGRMMSVARSTKPSKQSIILQRRRRARMGDGLVSAYRAHRLH